MEGHFNKDFFDFRNDPARNPKQNLVQYPETAKMVAKYFHGKSILEAGCGQGWITKHLQDMSENAVGFDIVPYAVDNSVAKGTFRADIRDLGWIRESWDIVICFNVLAYLEEYEVPRALSGLSDLFREHLVMCIVTWQLFALRARLIGFDMRLDITKLPTGHMSDRKTAQTRDWWLEQMFAVGLEEDYELYKKINFDSELITGTDFRDQSKLSGMGWKGVDNLFIMKHSQKGDQ